MIKKFKRILLFFIVIVYLIFEELVWVRVVAPIYHFAEKLHLYDIFLEYVKNRAGRYTVLFLFVLPFIVGEGLGIASGVLAANMYIVGAIMLYLLKIPLVLLAFSILKNSKDTLYTFAWFMYLHKMTLKGIDVIKNSGTYLLFKKLTHSLKLRIISVKNKLLILIRRFV
jgi:hypothetical protein